MLLLKILSVHETDSRSRHAVTDRTKVSGLSLLKTEVFAKSRWDGSCSRHRWQGRTRLPAERRVRETPEIDGSMGGVLRAQSFGKRCADARKQKPLWV